MNIGKNIKELRNRKGFTQKDLAEKLNVTPQAVSRWELDTVEPSLDTIKDMCELFDVTIDQLMSENLDLDLKDNKDKLKAAPINLVINAVDDEKQEEPIQRKIEKVKAEIVEPEVESKPVGKCSRCGKPVYEGSCRKVTNARTQKVIYTCPECLAKEEKKKSRNYNKFRLRAYIVSAIVATVLFGLFLAGAILNKEEINIGIGIGVSFAVGVLTFTTIFCIMIQNNFIGDMWMDVATWGCVKLPGIIFTLDFHGIIFLIITKILFFILSGILVIGALILATVLAAACSIFVFPVAVYWAHKKPEKSLLI